MKVRALLFPGPGRGERLLQQLDADDAGMPTDAKSCGARSVKAVKHFWPSVVTGLCMKVTAQRGRLIAEGMGWQVEWITDQVDAERTAFLSRLYEGNASPDEVIKWAGEYEKEMVCPM
jgi:hypothetical protein